MNTRKWIHFKPVALLAALAALVGSAIVAAGPPDPPAGPITGTYKTLAEVEPRTAVNATNTPGDAECVYRITQRGSYYLAGNLAGVVGKHGIIISAMGVTLDLNGFDLVGAPAMGAFDGVTVSGANVPNIAVINGSVRSWGGDGIDLGSASVIGGRIANVTASFNLGHGISISRTGTVRNCSANWNTGRGINTSEACTITGCSAYRNTSDGIFVGAIAAISDCSSHSNLGRGIVSSLNSALSNCTATYNTGNGIDVGNSSTLTNCTASNNTGIGINIGDGGTITNCSTYMNSTLGIAAATNCTITNSTAHKNGSYGIATTTGATVTGCSATENTATGIYVGSGCTVADCSVASNSLDGIACSLGCVIRGNTCKDNGFNGDGAGIHALSGYNRIEGNNCIRGDRGIDVDQPGNIIIRNTCSDATINWTLWESTIMGPIIDCSAAVSPFISGSSAPGNLGSTDPNANFSF